MSSSSAAKAALRSGEWTEATDPKGRKYYVQKKTKKTTWDLDKELAGGSSAPGSAASSSAGSASPSSKPGSTLAAVSSPSGSATDAVAAALKQGDWVEKVEPKSGKKFYFNKTTKATTWDLAKELGAVSKPAAADGGTAAAASTASGAASDTQAAIKQVLAAGEWQEKTDPKSGKVYYVNKATKKTTWDLAKELGLSATSSAAATTDNSGAATSSAAASSTPVAYAAPPKPVKSYVAATVLQSGEWKKGESFNGTTYYLNTVTGETTADLQLFLDVQQALDNANDADIEAGWKKLNGGRPTNDWLSLILRAPGHEAAADRLMAPYVQKRLADAEEAVAQARRAEDTERSKNQQLEITVSELRKSLEAHQREVHQLQCAVFYGVGGSGHSGASNSASGLSRYVPAAIDPTVAHNPNNPNALATRIEYLEKLLYSAQGHNTVLQEEIAELRRKGHEKVTCQHCTDNDAWRRVLDSAKGERPLPTSQGLLPSLTPEGFDAVAQRRIMAAGLQHHLPPPPSQQGINATPTRSYGLQQQQSTVRWDDESMRQRHHDPIPTPLPPNVDVLRYLPKSITSASFAARPSAAQQPSSSMGSSPYATRSYSYLDRSF